MYIYAAITHYPESLLGMTNWIPRSATPPLLKIMDNFL